MANLMPAPAGDANYNVSAGPGRNLPLTTLSTAKLAASGANPCSKTASDLAQLAVSAPGPDTNRTAMPPWNIARDGPKPHVRILSEHGAQKAHGAAPHGAASRARDKAAYLSVSTCSARGTLHC